MGFRISDFGFRKASGRRETTRRNGETEIRGQKSEVGGTMHIAQASETGEMLGRARLKEASGIEH